MAQRILHLTLKKQWFDMIASGEKKEEYREIKPHWFKRLLWLHSEVENVEESCEELINYCRTNEQNFFLKQINAELSFFQVVQFANGYKKNAPSVKVKCDGIFIGAGKPEWGAEAGKNYFVIVLGEIITS